MNINNIIPAHQWYAIYQISEHEHIKVALVCWAQTSEDTALIVGMVATDDGEVIDARDYTPENSRFLRYDLMVDDIETEFLSADELN